MTKRLLYLNGLATLGVIFNHSIAWGFIGMFFWTQRYLPVSAPNFDQMGSPNYYGLRFLEQLVTPTIAAFLLVSGYFVAFATRKGQDSPSWKFLGNRIRLLVLPYLLWTVVMILYYHFLEGVDYTPGDLLRNLLTGQTTDAFYFIPLLVQFYLLVPLLARFARDHWKALLILAGIFQGLVQILRYPLILGIAFPGSPILTALTPGWFFPGNIFWFCGGMVLGFHLNEIKPWLARMRWGSLAASIVLLAAGIFEWEWILQTSGQNWLTPKVTLLDNFYTLFFLAGFIGFEDLRLPASGLINNLGSKSFGIYLSHSLVLIITARAVYHFLPAILPVQFVFQPLLIAASLGIPLLVISVFHRTPLKVVYSYVFG